MFDYIELPEKPKNKYLDGSNSYLGYKPSPEQVMFYSARNRAKRKRLPFDIEISDIVIPEFCPILGMKLERSTSGRQIHSSPSLDRISPKLGYVKGNVQVISHRANTMKSDATEEQLKKFAEWILK